VQSIIVQGRKCETYSTQHHATYQHALGFILEYKLRIAQIHIEIQVIDPIILFLKN
jgi:hypothetical protein